MKINLINNKSYYTNENISLNKKNNKNNNDKINFKAYCGADKRAIADLSEEELKILAKYIEKLKNTKFCDFKIIQHPDVNWCHEPVVSIRALPSADLYSYTGTETAYNRGRVNTWGVGEHKVNGSHWLDSPHYDPSERKIRACHSNANNWNQANLYHFKKQNGIDFNSIYNDIVDRHSSDRRIFQKRYNSRLFDGITLVDAIETYNKKLIEAKNSINEIFGNICK